MMNASSLIRPPAWVALATLAFSLLLPATVRAATPVLLWGFQRGCERMPDLDHQVEKELFTQRSDVGLVSASNGKPLPACSGEQCAQALRAACPSQQGRLLGGQVTSGRGIIRTRLWLYDLATGQIAYQDDYCQSCGMQSAVTAHARHLIDKPVFGVPPGAAPSYCAPAAARFTQSESEQKSGPIFLTVFGDGKHKPALYDALRQQLGLRNRPVLPVPVESKNYGLEELRSLVAGQRDAQVLGVNITKDSKVQVFLFDQRSERTNAKTVPCSDCGQDKDTLIARVQPEVSSILEYCFGLQCADPRARPQGIQPPVEACEPFAEPTCSGSDLLATAAGPTVSRSGRIIDPSTAKIVKGLTWGAFAISAATAIGLFIADSTDAGTRIDANNRTIQHQLNYPAWTAAGLSAVMLGIAIPSTLVVNRASRLSSSPPAAETATGIQCPIP